MVSSPPGSISRPSATPESHKPTYKRRQLDPGSPGYQYAQSLLLLHLPNAHRSFLRIDSVVALQNDKALREWNFETQGLCTRDAWFYPFPEDDVDTVTRAGFGFMDKRPIRMGLYFVEQTLPSQRGPVLKMVLCKAAVGKSICRAESDISMIARCPAGYQSVYVPSQTDPSDGIAPSEVSVFSDTYIMYDSQLVVPTHVISYHLEVDKNAMMDDDLLTWVNERCLETFGFAESSFAHYFLSLARSSDSVGELAIKLRDQADVPVALVDQFARELFDRISQSGASPQRSSAGATFQAQNEVDGDQLMESLLLLGLEDDSVEQGPPLPPAPHVLDEAVQRVESCMAEIESLGESLKEKCSQEDLAAEDFDQLLFERSAVFKAELVTYLKEYMLTLQVAEEREQEMTRAINDSFNAHEFMVQQKDSKTKVAMLTQWKNLLGLRNDLRRRVSALTGLTGASLVWLTPTEDDQAIAELERQQEQKARVLALLQKRLGEVPQHELTPEEVELLQICEE